MDTLSQPNPDQQPLVLPAVEQREDLGSFSDRLAQEAAVQNQPVRGVFNQTNVIATPGSSSEAVTAAFYEARQPLEPKSGEHIGTFTTRLVSKATTSGHPISGAFNGIGLTATPDSDPQELADSFFSDHSHQSHKV